MRIFTALCLCSLIMLPCRAESGDPDDRLYGQVTTKEGRVYEGYIRWDKNEASWVDILDGSKLVEWGESSEKRRKIEIFGYTLVEFDDENGGSTYKDAGIRFGHLESLENIGNSQALLTLRSGQVIELRNSSTDIGNAVRGIVVEDVRRGKQELKWRNLERIDFMPAPRGLDNSRSGERLFGTLVTRSGHEFTGYVCWDIDEVLGEDILDGEDEEGWDREIRFADIALLAREDSRSSYVRLKSGEEMILHGTNDVNDENRGILIMDPALGQVRVRWRDFEELSFSEPEYAFNYDYFYTTGPIRGTVETREGVEKFTGEIRWDNDETYTWEMLNGELDDVEFTIELGLIEQIERVSTRAARVLLFDGREFELRGSNDVNDENDGIVVLLRDGESVMIDWQNFDRVIFEKP